MNAYKLIALALVLPGAVQAQPSHFGLTFAKYKGYLLDQACTERMFQDFEIAAMRDEMEYSGKELLYIKAAHIEAINQMVERCKKAAEEYERATQ